MLGVADGRDRHGARGAVERGAGVVPEHRAAERAVAAGPDDEQVGALGFCGAVRPRPGLSASMLISCACTPALSRSLSSRVLGGLALLADQSWGDRVRGAQTAWVYVRERERAIGVCQA